VLPDSRGSGIGSALLDAVDTALSNQDIPNLNVAVMCGNEAAIRLYRRRGFVPGELILYRICGTQAAPVRKHESASALDRRASAASALLRGATQTGTVRTAG
jgi:ribosomal protein S18 acetylase RimI-like enzyme